MARARILAFQCAGADDKTRTGRGQGQGHNVGRGRNDNQQEQGQDKNGLNRVLAKGLVAETDMQECLITYTEGFLFVTAILFFQTENTGRRNYSTNFHEFAHGCPSP